MRCSISVCLIVLSLLIGTVSALSVSSVIVNPDSPVLAESPVAASFNVNISGYPAGIGIRFSTAIDNPSWTFTIIGIHGLHPTSVIDVSQLPMRAKTVTVHPTTIYLSGSDSGEPDSILKVTLEGIIPASSRTSLTIFNVSETDANGRQLSSAVFEQIANISSKTQSMNSPSSLEMITLVPKITVPTSTIPTIVNDSNYMKSPKPVTDEGIFDGILHWFKGLFGMQP